VRNGSNVYWIIGAIVATQTIISIASLANDGGESAKPNLQAGEDRWVPSLAITSGITIQQQKGSADSVVFEDMTPPPIPLRGFVNGKDTAVSPFVGGVLELMAPALSIPTRPRLFASGEILPTFASDRDVALESDPGCIHGPRPGAKCLRDGGAAFPESAANGEGTRTSAEIDTVVFGASLGMAFPFQVGKRQLRIKPSVGWINYEVDAEGLVVSAKCGEGGDPVCTSDSLRETTLSASDSQRFNGFGPGLDVEMDTGRYGPLGVSLFLGGRAYAIVNDRTISFEAEEIFDDQDQYGMDRAVGRFEVEVDRWIYRAHMGIRVHWLGKEK
jgi:hypothetical protein